MRLLHLVNCFAPPVGSEWAVAAPLTLETMRGAQENAHQQAAQHQVVLASTHFAEDAPSVPLGFVHAPLLTRSVQDLRPFADKRRLPLLADIVANLHKAALEHQADYVVFTNLDIALQPHFYLFVFQAIEQHGWDAFMINRRILPALGVGETPVLQTLFEQKGKPHPGFDCFVLKPSLLPHFVCGDICLGIPFVEATFTHNLFAWAQRVHLYDQEYLTFHLGDDIMPPRPPDLYWHNRRAFFGYVKPALWPHLRIERFPYAQLPLLQRYWRWGLNPSLFTLLCLRLDARRGFIRHRKTDT